MRKEELLDTREREQRDRMRILFFWWFVAVRCRATKNRQSGRKAKEKQDQVRERQGPAGDPSCPREAGGVWLFFRFFLLFLHTVNGVLDRIEGVQVFCCSSITLGYCHLVVEAGLGGIF